MALVNGMKLIFSNQTDLKKGTYAQKGVLNQYVHF